MKTINELWQQSQNDAEGMRLGYTTQQHYFAALVAAAEREAIYAEWHSCVMADLENGVKWLNEKAAAEWHANYPAQSKTFPAWIEARGQA